MTLINEVRVEIYRSFLEDVRSPRPEEIAYRVDHSTDEVVEALRELAASDVIAFLPGTEELWLAHPFCATDASFKVASVRGTWDAICIWDALGVLALLESDGSVSTTCPDCGAQIGLEVVGGVVEAPPGALVHFGVPASRWYEDIGFT